MSVIGTVVELWRYPVSSLGGERLPQLAVQEAGVEGDRQFGVVDTRSGEIASPNGDARWRPVPLIRSRLRSGSPEISTDGDNWFGVPGEAADRAVSAFLGFPCAVRPYRGGDPLSPPAAVNRYEPSPIHLVTTASLAALPLSGSCLIAAIQRDGFVRVPEASDTLRAGDVIVALIDQANFDRILEMFEAPTGGD